MLADTGWLALGLVLLALGADSALKGGSGIALKLGMNPARAGVLALLLGAALPELAFGLEAARADALDLAYSVLLGRILANLGLVLGLLHLLVALPRADSSLRFASGAVVASALVFWWLSRNGVVSRIEGLALLGLFGLVLGLAVVRVRRVPVALQRELEAHAATRSEHWRSALRLLIGIVASAYGARYLLESVQALAGPSGPAAILATVALSLPLLGVAWFAAFRGQGQVALGLVLGSCLFQLLALGGVLAATQVLPVPASALRFELPATAALAVLASVLLSGAGLPARAKGAVLALAYLMVLVAGVWLAPA